MELLIIIFLLITLIVVLVLSHLERKDLYNRIMAGNLTEYQSIKEVENKIETTNDETLSLEDAREEIENDLINNG